MLIIAVAIIALLVIAISVLSVLLYLALKRVSEAEANALLKAKDYLVREEARMRADAIARSEHVVKGKVAEQLVPFGPEFTYNPRDCRFLGSPVDFVVFDGLTEGILERVVFVEVKTGESGRLSSRERKVQAIIEQAEVGYEVLHLRPEES